MGFLKNVCLQSLFVLHSGQSKPIVPRYSGCIVLSAAGVYRVVSQEEEVSFQGSVKCRYKGMSFQGPVNSTFFFFAGLSQTDFN